MENSLLKLLSAQEENPGLSPEREQEYNTAALVAGATPLLVGLLSGGRGRSFEVGAKGMQTVMAMKQREEESTSKRLMDYLKLQKSAEKTSGGRYQQATIEMGGKPLAARFDKLEGTYSLPSGETISQDAIKGYKPDVRTEPFSKGLMRVTSEGDTQMVTPPGQEQPPRYNVRQREEVLKLKEQIKGNKQYKDSKTSYLAAGRALELLQSKNPVSDEGIKVIFPRMFGEVGNLAVQEQERFSGSPALRQKYEALKSKYTRGTLDEQDRSDLLEVARVMQDYSAKVMSNTLQEELQSYSKITGVPLEKLSKDFEDFHPKRGKVGKISKKAKEKMKSTPGVTLRRMYKGKERLFEKTDKGWRMVR